MIRNPSLGCYGHPFAICYLRFAILERAEINVNRKKKEKEQREESIRQQELLSYSSLMKSANKTSNREANLDLEDDFM